MLLALLLGGLAVSFASIKAGTTPAVPNPVWPLPPDEPRVVYVKSISGPADIGQTPSLWGRLAHWATGSTGQSQNLQKPFSVALDESGNLCLTDTGANTVSYCDFQHKKWHSWNAVGKIRFQSPVAVVRRNGIFYVADSQLAKILAFKDNGKLLFQISAPLKRPVGLAINGSTLAVADSQAHCIFMFDLQGNFRSRLGQRGTGPGEFNFPTDVAFDTQNHLLVNDSLNSRVQVFAADGKFLSAIGGAGDTSGNFGRPKGVAVDTFNHIYVADALFNNVQIFDLSGRLLLSLGEAGTAPGQFGLPTGLAIGTNNLIYVADGYNHRIQVLKYIGGQ